MIPPLDPHLGVLPTGRFPATTTECKTQFATNDHRQKIWSEWEAATTNLRSIVPVASAWLGGSFFSSKQDPGDIDCVYTIETSLAQAVTDPMERNVLAVYARNLVTDVFGHRVDTFVVDWVPNATQGSGPAPHYYSSRGWWDDFWCRMRPTGLSTQEMRLSSTPQRGYLEVTLDGFKPQGPVITS